MSKKAKTKYTKKRPRPLNRAGFARLVGVSPPAIGTYIKRKIIKPHAQTKKFNPIKARDAIRANTVQGPQLKMNLDFEVNDAGECYFPNADQDPNPPIKQESEYPDADDMFTEDEKDKGIPDEKEDPQDEFDFDNVPNTLTAQQIAKLKINNRRERLKLLKEEGALFDPVEYVKLFQAVMNARDKGIYDKILESINQTTAYTAQITDPIKVREMQTKIIHGVLKDIVTLEIIDYLPERIVERIRAAGLDESVGVVG